MLLKGCAELNFIGGGTGQASLTILPASIEALRKIETDKGFSTVGTLSKIVQFFSVRAGTALPAAIGRKDIGRPVPPAQAF